MAANIHTTAIVDPSAQIADDASIGPFCLIGPYVSIGARSVLRNHVTVVGGVTIGEDNDIFPNCVIGCEPQDKGYRQSAKTRVEIGDRNIIREAVTIHRGTEKEDGVTRVGSDNFFMGGCHIAHDCKVGSHINMANCTLLGGHVHVHDYASTSGLIAVHHFTTIGSYSFIGGLTRIVTDVPPFMLIEGHPAVVRCLNLVGLKRRGFTANEIKSLSEAHRLIYRVKMHYAKAWEILESHGNLTKPVRVLFDHLSEQRLGRFGRGRERFRKAA
jgi:UDP-N-acetylglucosamine acyltransferase